MVPFQPPGFNQVHDAAFARMWLAIAPRQKPWRQLEWSVIGVGGIPFSGHSRAGPCSRIVIIVKIMLS